MADITRQSSVTAAVMYPPPNTQVKGTAAVDLASGDMVYMTNAGALAKTNGAANNALAQWVGIVFDAAKAGQPVTAYHSVEVAYAASGLTPGANVYVSTTAGALSDTATTGGDVPCGKVLSTGTILILQPRK